MSLKNTLKQTLTNLLGKQIKDKVVVIESDDWGAIRTSSKDSLIKLAEKGVKVNNCHYTLYDSLASESDLTTLFDFLTGFKDSVGNHPVITANALMANPDFKKIKESDFKEYHFEKITKTFERYASHAKSFDLWLKGEADRLFIPQLHGREHLNVRRWLESLQNKDTETLCAFEQEMYGLSSHIVSHKRLSHLAAFDGENNTGENSRENIMLNAVDLFQTYFQASPVTFMAPNYTWDAEIEKTAHENGIKFFQGANVQRYPRGNGDELRIKRHYRGQKSPNKIEYGIRNVLFEPSSNRNIDWVDKALRDIHNAFIFKQPAVIETHRVNFVGNLEVSNRENTLILLKRLLKEILKRWPEVKFMSTPDLYTMQKINK